MQKDSLSALPESIASTGHNQDETSRAATLAAQVHALCSSLDGLDEEIARLERQVADLPGVLDALAGHPVLWLLLGRAGVDRPGSLGAMVGQQVVTVTRPNHRALIAVGVGMLLVGLVLGLGLHQWLTGGFA